jgi:divinyl protochlorophyllide a 8-vinyl-reductase
MSTLESSSSEVAAAPARARTTPARIGPNSVLQTMRALRELEAPDVARRVAAQAALPDPLPPGMIPEAWFVSLVGTLRDALPPDRAEAVQRRAGRYTADYVGNNRIPRAFRGLLAVLPARASIPLLLAAFARHAWTFAGGGRFRVEGAFPGTIVLGGCPTCRDEHAGAIGGGAYYEAAFEGLLRLAAPGVRVTEITCQARGAPACRFQISLHPLGEPPCASS